jgi:hypothetical protein
VCKISGKCYQSGDKDPLGCAVCDPTKDPFGWTLLSKVCKISGKCHQSGDKDPLGCVVCDPTKDPSGWTPLPGVCKISGKCHQPGDKHPLGCAECDPALSTTSWTVKGSACLIDNNCSKPGEKDVDGCAECAPQKDKYGWSPLPGMCKVGGTCLASGAKHPGGCATCDPAVSATSWTVSTNACLVGGACRKPAEKDPSGCLACDPQKDKHGWTPLAGMCGIDGACYPSGATHPDGCATCDPLKSPAGWTATAGCVIAHACHAAGAKHPSGCGTCDPSKSTTEWTVSGSGCLVGSACHTWGDEEPGGCGVCDPAKSTTAWTRPPGCLASHGWSKALGGPSEDVPASVAFDGAGNSYITGHFYKTVDLGGGPLASNGAADIFIVSFTPSGKHRWSKAFGGNGVDHGRGVAVDPKGNVYITGNLDGTVDFGGGPLTNNNLANAFLASFTASGKHRWSKSFGGPKSTYAHGVAVDGAGNVHITGSTLQPLDFGGGMLPLKGFFDAFLASFTTNGVHRWSKLLGGPASDYGNAVAVDDAGNAYITGSFSQTASFGGAKLVASALRDVFVASYDSSGTHRWSKRFGGVSNSSGRDIAAAPGGNLNITGRLHSDIDFGGGKLVSKGGGDVFVASLTAKGKHRWSRSFDCPHPDHGLGVAADADGNAYVTGYFSGVTDLGGGPLTSKGHFDVYVASFSSSGAHRWSRSHGGAKNDYGRQIAVDAAGRVHAIGDFTDSVDLGGGVLKSAGLQDAFVLQITQ